MASPSDPRPASISSRSFAVARKGFDPDEVRAYLGQLAEVIDRLTAERDAARTEVGDLRTAAEARPVVDEDQLTAALGEETARVLTSARRAAAEIKERAEESVARLLREAAESAGQTRREADTEAARLRDEAAAVRAAADEDRARGEAEMAAEAERLRAEGEAAAAALRAEAETARAEAEAAASATRAAADEAAAAVRAEAEAVLGVRSAEADAAAAAIVSAGEAEAEALRQAARADAEAIRADAAADKDAAQAEGREMVAEAQRVRERMLADLSRRRKAARVQLEQLQAARDRLLESYDAVQRTIDEATSGLRRALPDARAAADAARLRAEAEPEASVEQLEGQIAAARAAGLPLVAPDGGDPAVIDLTAEETEVVAAEPVTGEVEAVVLDKGEPEPEPEAVEPEAVVEVVVEEVLVVEEVVVAVVDPSEEPTQPVAVVEPQAVESEAGEPEAVESEAGEPEGELWGEPDAADAVFAKLRAAQEDDAPAPPAEEPEAEAEPEVEPVAEAESEPEVEPEDEPEAEDAPEAEGDEVLLSLLERRDGAVEPIESRVARRLKRVLADEQGTVLDGVRREKGRADLDVLLPLDAQVASYVEAVLDDLAAAAEEGAAFEGAALPPSTPVAPLAEELARDLVGVVRPRVERCFDGVEDADDVSDRLRATYREWKTDRLMEISRHAVLSAFGRGQVAVRPAGAPVRWVPDPTAPPCPDCEDDALAGALPSGEAFPTGHAHPPAHQGCRCIVVGADVLADDRAPAGSSAR